MGDGVVIISKCLAARANRTRLSSSFLLALKRSISRHEIKPRAGFGHTEMKRRLVVLAFDARRW